MTFSKTEKVVSIEDTVLSISVLIKYENGGRFWSIKLFWTNGEVTNGKFRSSPVLASN